MSTGNDDLFNIDPDKLHDKRICEKHFKSTDYEINIVLNNKRLKSDAVPLRCPEPTSTSSTSQNCPTVTSHQICSGTFSPTTHSTPQISSETVSSAIALSSEVSVISSQIPSTPSRKRKRIHETEKDDTPQKKKKKLNSPIPKMVTPTRKRKLNIQENKAVDTPQKKKLKLRLARKNLKLKRISSHVSKLKSNKVSLKISAPLENQIKNFQFPSKASEVMCLNQFKKTGDRKIWSPDAKKLALDIFHSSPSGYKAMLANKIVNPSISTVRRWIGKFSCPPGFNSSIFEGLEKKFKDESEVIKYCALLLDEMSIKECLEYDKNRDFIEGFEDLGELGRKNQVANHVLVLMARGIYGKWKTPIAYFLSKGGVRRKNLSAIIKQCLQELFAVGLVPKAVVCDQGSNNRGAFKDLGVTLDSPFFHLNQKKIVAIYDIPHLFKSIRNNMLNGNFVTPDGKMISFLDIKSTYLIDKKSKSSRALTKITDSHINPVGTEKMSVKKAVQVLSHSMASTMRTAVNTGQLESGTALATADFIEMANNLFDSLNSKGPFDVNPYQLALRKTGIAHDTLKTGLEFFSKLKKRAFKKSETTRPPCFDGLVQTIRGVLELSKDGEQINGITYLCVNQLNQDPLENLFSIFRQRGGYNRNPTARTLRTSFRSEFGFVLLNDLSVRGTNCEMDRASFVEYLCSKEKAGLETKHTDTSTVELEPEDEDDEEMVEDDDSGEKQPEYSLEKCSNAYFAGRLIQMIGKKIECNRCNQFLKESENSKLFMSNNVLIYEKSYRKDLVGSQKGLQFPTETFAKVLEKILNLFTSYFDKIIHKKNLRSNLRKLIEKDPVVHSWLDHEDEVCCEHRQLIIDAALKIKIFHVLKERNADDLKKKRINKNKTADKSEKCLLYHQRFV